MQGAAESGSVSGSRGRSKAHTGLVLMVLKNFLQQRAT